MAMLEVVQVGEIDMAEAQEGLILTLQTAFEAGLSELTLEVLDEIGSLLNQAQRDLTKCRSGLGVH